MEMLLRNWPHAIKQLAIVGHIMGGLVARSACYYARLAGYAWPKRLDHLVFLGTPHLGAPLASTGTWTDFLVGISPYTAPFTIEKNATLVAVAFADGSAPSPESIATIWIGKPARATMNSSFEPGRKKASSAA